MDGGVAVASLINAAELTGRLFLRSLDYCPPVDIDFGDYARAIMASDKVAYPIDTRGFRDDLYDVFRARGIIAKRDTGEETGRTAFPGQNQQRGRCIAAVDSLT